MTRGVGDRGISGAIGADGGGGGGGEEIGNGP